MMAGKIRVCKNGEKDREVWPVDFRQSLEPNGWHRATPELEGKDVEDADIVPPADAPDPTKVADVDEDPEAPAADADTKEAIITDAALKVLNEAGIDPSTVTGTGEGGKITKPDAEKAVEEAKAAPEE